MFLIECPPNDPSGMLVKQRLDAMGAETAHLNTVLYPKQIQIHYNPEIPEQGKLQLPHSTNWIPLTDIQGVFRRGPEWIEANDTYDFMKRELVYWNIECALGSLYRLMTHCKWVNPLEEFNQHRHKAFQLQQFSQLGVRIPKTIVSNSVEDIQAFFHEENGNVILKYPHGGKHTVQLTEEDIYHAGFAEHLTKIPVKIQECINGMDIRVYVIGEDCFALEIHSDKLDFRETPNTFRKAIKLPEAIRQQCLLICKTLGLHMAGIDIKRTETGEHVFLEANPSPVFLYDEVASGYPISQTIANLLMA